ncbi:MAG: hypothetical protein ABIO44_08970 [Saprospiraceae bacterium]
MKAYLLWFSLIIFTLAIICCNNPTTPPGGPSATGNPPTVPYNPNPHDSTNGVSRNVFLVWHTEDPDTGDSTLCDIYMSKTSPPNIQIASNVRILGYQPDRLDSLTTYYWEVFVRDLHGHTVTGPVWRFTTGNF